VSQYKPDKMQEHDRKTLWHRLLREACPS
jgi:hypothetical protein